MDVNNYVLSLAALTGWREERSNGINGILAVMFVLKNRVNAGWNGKDLFSVITAPNQFDSMIRVGDSQTVVYPHPTDQLFVKACQYADGIFDGTTADNLTQGALYYADTSSAGYNKTGWFQRNIVENAVAHPRTTQIGTTLYFR